MLSQNVRILFSKTGKLKYISHLDLCRTLRTAFKRAQIPIWYSQGFNPHAKMVFATTVSVGNESLCELLDIKITHPMEESEFVSRLQGQLTGDIKILKAYTPQTSFMELMWAEYEIILENGITPEELEKALSSDMIIIKKTKNGPKEENIRPLIKSVSLFQNRITCILSGVQSRFLSPDNFVLGLEGALGRELYALSVVRTHVYDENMNEFR